MSPNKLATISHPIMSRAPVMTDGDITPKIVRDFETHCTTYFINAKDGVADVTILSFALLYADTSDCLLSFIPHLFTGPLYFYDLISLTRSHLAASCPVRYDLPCTIRIYEPPI